jgi:hypothetical protein
MLSQFLGRTMQQSDVWIGTFHHFTIQLQHQAQHTVRSRMLWAKVHRVIFNFRHNELSLRD